MCPLHAGDTHQCRLQADQGVEWKAVISSGRGFWEDYVEKVAEGPTKAGGREWMVRNGPRREKVMYWN